LHWAGSSGNPGSEASLAALTFNVNFRTIENDE
jgi:hypothetical protein